MTPSAVAARAAQPEEVFAVQLLRALPIRAEQYPQTYTRRAFEHWTEVCRSGCNALYYVLWQENAERPKPRFASKRGRWSSVYDARMFGHASRLDVDHMVPLAEAWRSGAAKGWDSSTRRRYANDVGYMHSLIAVSASSNRSKGDENPARGMPPRPEFHCVYATRWIAVEYRWRLSVDTAERSALLASLQGCSRGENVLRRPPRALVTNVKTKPHPRPSPGGSGGGGGGGIPLQPDLPGDQDCYDMPGPVRVLPGDPDGLDGDGIGCE